MLVELQNAAEYARNLLKTSAADQEVEDSPAYPSPAWLRMMKSSRLPDALMGGTERMRDEAETWYPIDEGETPDAWKARVARATLWPAFRRTVEYLAGRPFEQPIDLGAIKDPELLEWLEDVDGAQHDLSVFVYEALTKALVRGMHYVLVDNHPRAGTGSKGQDRRMGIRPRLIHMPISRVWRVIPANVLGKEVPGQAHIYSPRVEKSGKFGAKVIHEIKVYTLVLDDTGAPIGVDVTTYRQLPDKLGSLEAEDWPKSGDPRRLKLKRIPLVLVPANMVGFHEAQCSLIDLAYMNLAQFQSDGDQRHILHVARVPMLVLSGVAAGFERLWVGIRRLWRLDSPTAKLSWVEPKGTAIGSGKTDIDDLKAGMSQVGGDHLNPRPGHPTATGKAIDFSADNSRLKAIVLCLESVVNDMISLMAEMGGRPDQPGDVLVHKDFDAIVTTEDLSDLRELRKDGDLSRPTIWREYRRRGTLGDDFDAKKEEALLAKEAQAQEDAINRAAMELEKRMQEEEQTGGPPPQDDKAAA